MAIGKVARGAYERVGEAFHDLSQNRLSIPDNTRVWNATQVLVAAARERDGIKDTTIKQYDETGKGWEDATQAPAELVSKLIELNSEIVELDFGPGVPAENLKDAKMLPVNFNILKEINFIE